ncbi:riboflavin synthase [Thioflexithrix psekupsensis]|uniref:Riboflavin synthase n=1 Tax=Thioflexithrix psekupsensis TaxID=1570016 RepID=A0A251X934_9GAMM|nr:riboflavin synthase [Thioflexithrix psekupsensis]OUD14032.1 riboflavin synthase subunit alpha [Thioflexithrix psekupsensis]
MFTGIIQAVGQIAQRQELGADARLYVRTGQLPLAGVQLGDSIATNGVCLTAVALPGDGFWADVSGETLSRTTLGQLHVGSLVNLETALTLQTPLGGHLVSGHVDGVGRVIACHNDGRSLRVTIESPNELARYIAAKGSICVDGISLTVNAVNGCQLSLNIVPHTANMTTWKEIKVGQFVNLEVDLIARYLERLLLGEKAAQATPLSEKITESFLQQHGFIR